MMDVLPPAGMMDVVHPALPPPPADGSPALSAGQPGLGAGQPGAPTAPPPIPPGQPFGAPTEFYGAPPLGVPPGFQQPAGRQQRVAARLGGGRLMHHEGAPFAAAQAQCRGADQQQDDHNTPDHAVLSVARLARQSSSNWLTCSGAAGRWPQASATQTGVSRPRNPVSGSDGWRC